MYQDIPLHINTSIPISSINKTVTGLHSVPLVFSIDGIGIHTSLTLSLVYSFTRSFKATADREKRRLKRIKLHKQREKLELQVVCDISINDSLLQTLNIPTLPPPS